MNLTRSLLATLPIMIMMGTGMFVLVFDACLGFWRRAKYLSGGLSLVGICAAAVCSLRLLGADSIGQVYGGALTADHFAQACSLILLLAAGLAVLLAMTYLENRNLNLGEYYGLVLLSTSGAMIMAGTTELITLFVAIEILSVALYVLAGFARTEERSDEAALKYFLLGAFASGFLLYGIALVYGGSGLSGVAGTTNLTELVIQMHGAGTTIPSLLLMAGFALVLVGLCFKAALVPFHMWTPDVYEGAPTSVTAYMAACAKIGAFAALLRLLNAFIPVSEYWLVAIQVIAVLTMFFGNLLAIRQDNIKRMLAYSSIAHAGYILVALSAATGKNPAAHDAAISAVIFYLLAYTLMTMGAFAVLIWLSHKGRDVQTVNDLKGLVTVDPPAAYVMLIFMLSLGGIPPTMGFLGKWLIISATLSSGQTWLAIVMGTVSIMSVYYYLRVVWMMCFQEPDAQTVTREAEASSGVKLSIFLTVGGSLLLGVFPNLIQPLMSAAASVIRP